MYKLQDRTSNHVVSFQKSNVKWPGLILPRRLIILPLFLKKGAALFAHFADVLSWFYDSWLSSQNKKSDFEVTTTWRMNTDRQFYSWAAFAALIAIIHLYLTLETFPDKKSIIFVHYDKAKASLPIIRPLLNWTF